MKVEISADELWPSMRWMPAYDGDKDAFEVPDHLIHDLRIAHYQLTKAEKAVTRHLLESGQWDRAHTPQDWMD